MTATLREIVAGVTQAVDDMAKAYAVLVMHRVEYPTTPYPIALEEIERAKQAVKSALCEFAAHLERQTHDL